MLQTYSINFDRIDMNFFLIEELRKVEFYQCKFMHSYHFFFCQISINVFRESCTLLFLNWYLRFPKNENMKKIGDHKRLYHNW